MNTKFEMPWQKRNLNRENQQPNNTWRNQRSIGTPGAENEHWCETCDRGFNSIIHLENHKRQHQKCNIDGCQFTAHPKVITKHIQMQHSSGLYKKLANLNQPEEIKKWIEERKSKYPTRKCIEKKNAELKEKIERGEKMGLKNDKRPNTDKRQNLRKPGIERNRKSSVGSNINNYKQKRSKSTKCNNSNNMDVNQNSVETTLNNKRRLKPFEGIQNMIMDVDIDNKVENRQDENNDFIIEDDESSDSTPVKEEEQQNAPYVCNALSSLMCSYESSDEDNENKIPITNNRSNESVNQKNDCKSFKVCSDGDKLENSVSSELILDDNNDKPDEVKILKNVEPGAPVDEKCNKTHNVKKQPLKAKSRPVYKHKVPSTLLHKLLRNEIRQERNVILQCIRHTVKNNFFDN